MDLIGMLYLRIRHKFNYLIPKYKINNHLNLLNEKIKRI